MRTTIWVAEFAPASFGGSESGLAALGYEPRLYSSKNMDREAVGERHVHRNEVGAAFN